MSCFQVYAIELFYRFLHIAFGFMICLVLSFLKIDTVLLLKIYPFLKFSKETLLATKVTDLIDVVWTLSLNVSFLFIYPLFLYHLVTFLKTSFQKCQNYVLFRVLSLTAIIYVIIFYFLHSYVVPSVFNFLLSWKLNSFQNLLNIKTELRIIDYVDWILLTGFLISSIIYCLTTFLLKFLIIIDLNVIYNRIKKWKKQVLFFLIFLLFLLFPSDIHLQFSLLFISFLSTEFIFLFVCYIIKNSKNANYTTITKKTQKNQI
uniref:Sec-independent protein translocase component TatC n=1 Tax=Eucheuma denticulatum TaxID=305493 RepID=A0A2H4QI64_9FLOR|nr:Sec-independent protein translocase component TatC [Eucheuma denticulatum]ATX68852.1 Sec-independent protein translocase component TatC [Eucheuma denticulatum]